MGLALGHWVEAGSRSFKDKLSLSSQEMKADLAQTQRPNKTNNTAPLTEAKPRLRPLPRTRTEPLPAFFFPARLFINFSTDLLLMT